MADFKTGLGVDAAGGPVVDPSANVLDLVRAEARRQDDLRAASELLAREREDFTRREMDLREEFRKRIAVLRAEHQEKDLASEARRTDALRELDRAGLNAAVQRFEVAIETLSRETRATADTLRNSVETTRKTLADQVDSKNREQEARLSGVERFQAAGSGKAEATDPAMAKAFERLEALMLTQAQGTGKGLGARELWAYLAAGIALAITLYKALHG